MEVHCRLRDVLAVCVIDITVRGSKSSTMVGKQLGGSLNWLAESKSHSPLLREDVILGRHLLVDLRNRLSTYSLTLLSAPAGYG